MLQAYSSDLECFLIQISFYSGMACTGILGACMRLLASEVIDHEFRGVAAGALSGKHLLQLLGARGHNENIFTPGGGDS